MKHSLKLEFNKFLLVFCKMFYLGIYIAGLWLVIHLLFFVFFPESVLTEIVGIIFSIIGNVLSIIAIVILGLSSKYTLR